MENLGDKRVFILRRRKADRIPSLICLPMLSLHDAVAVVVDAVVEAVSATAVAAAAVTAAAVAAV